jgi:hypothetical protein
MTRLSRELVPPNPTLDLADWIGQRKGTFRFDLVNGVTGENLGEIHPLRSATLSHNTESTIKRQLTLSLGLADSAAIDKTMDRVLPYMVFPDGSEYPLGRYVFANTTQANYVDGSLVNAALTDEMFIVDQAIETGLSGVNVTQDLFEFFPGFFLIAGTNNIGENIVNLVIRVLKDLPIVIGELDATALSSMQAWPAGTYRGQILNDLALVGGYFSPWFDNYGQFRMIKAFEPAARTIDRLGRSHDSAGRFVGTSGDSVAATAAQAPVQVFDFDASNVVVRDTVIQTDDLLTRPNRFVVVSNSAVDSLTPIVGVAEVPENAPNSIANRGFAITSVNDLQVGTIAQATVTAQNLAFRQTILERVTLTTSPDPRHDSYDVIQWNGDLWLETAWSMEMVEGGQMTHTMRKSYS